jgi:DNA-binding transcriptional LysR family regulator
MAVLEFSAFAQSRQRRKRHARDSAAPAAESESKAVAFSLQHLQQHVSGGISMQTSPRKRVVDPEVAPLGLIHLRYIEMFQAILQAGTLTDAACLLNISQPAATKLLKQAERRLGFPLFVRVKGQWQLTPESRLLKPQIGRIFDDLRDLQRLIGNIARAEKQILRVVSTPTLANAIIPKSLTRLRQQLGQSSVELSTQHSREMLKSIALREADIGFTLQEINHPDVRCEPLCQGPLSLIAPVGTWSRAQIFQPIHINTLADAPLVSITKADSLGAKLEAHLEQLNPPARICVRVQTYQIAKDLVSSGEGMALIDPFTAVSSGPELQIRVVEPMMPIDLYAVYRVDGPLNRVQKSFIQCVKAVASESIRFLTASVDRLPVAQ